MQYEGKPKMLIKGKSCFLNNSGQQDLILENPRLHYYLEVTSSRIVTLARKTAFFRTFECA